MSPRVVLLRSALVLGIWGALCCGQTVDNTTYLAVRLLLPVETNLLPSDYKEKATADVAHAANVPLNRLDDAAFATEPPSFEVKIYSTVEQMPRVLAVLQSTVAAPSWRLAGVKISGSELRPIGTENDECAEDPCIGQLCADPDRLSPSDFVCTCVDGSGVARGAPANCTDPPHLEIMLYLPGSDPPGGPFNVSVQQELAKVLNVKPAAVLSVRIETDPLVAVANINAPSPAVPLFQSLLEEAVKKGMVIKGVRIQGIKSKIVAPGIIDECENMPCGPGQSCTDPSLSTSGDFVCSCITNTGLTYPMVGRPTPSCTAPLQDMDDYAGLLEALALSHGHTVLPAAHNSIMYASHCDAPLGNPPPALHPTGLTVGGSSLAGCVVGNTSLLVGAVVLQHLLVMIIAFYTKGSLDSGVIQAMVGYPLVPLRIFVTLLPGTFFCGIGLLDSIDKTWSILLGSVTLFLWLLCLGGMVFKGFASLVTHSIGQHEWDASEGWLRIDQFRRRHVAMVVLVTVVLSTNMSHRFGGGAACAGPRIFVSMGLFLYAAVIALTQPWYVKVHNILAFLVYVLQALGWMLMGIGLYEAEGHRQHDLVEASVYLRFVGACFLMLWLLVAVVFRVGGDEESSWWDPRSAVLAAWGTPHLQKAVLLSSDAVWVFLAVAIAVHWLFVFGALVALLVHFVLVMRTSNVKPATPHPTGLTEEDLLNEKLLVEQEDIPEGGGSGYSPPQVLHDADSDSPGHEMGQRGDEETPQKGRAGSVVRPPSSSPRFPLREHVPWSPQDNVDDSSEGEAGATGGITDCQTAESPE